MGEQNTKIQWMEYIQTYNRLRGTTFTSPAQLLRTIYEQEQTLKKTAGVLGLSVNTIVRYMKAWGLPRRPKGHRGNSPYQRAYRKKITNPKDHTHVEIAKIVGCSLSYVPHLIKSVAKRKKMVP